MLSMKSDEEIGWMLDDYGIKHGPVVGSTRSLYEKKLRDVMAKDRKMRGASERAVYREQHYEDLDVHQRRHWGNDTFSSRSMVPPYYTQSQGRYTEVRQERTQDRMQERTPDRMQERTQDRMQETTQGPDSGRFVPLWVQIVFFLIIAGVLVLIFINMEPAENELFKRLT